MLGLIDDLQIRTQIDYLVEQMELIKDVPEKMPLYLVLQDAHRKTCDTYIRARAMSSSVVAVEDVNAQINSLIRHALRFIELSKQKEFGEGLAHLCQTKQDRSMAIAPKFDHK